MGTVRLHEIAFGEYPDADVDDPRVVHPACDLHDVFSRAVALAGQGFYSRARSDLALVQAGARGERGTVMRSVAWCAIGSHRRQGGRHREALVADGAAALLASAPGRAASAGGRAALVDALTGLAADHLGTADLGAADRLLGRSEEIVALIAEEPADTTGLDWWLTGRPVLRTAWVRAEWHLYSGRGGAAALVADRADRLSRDCPSARHRLKTELLVAASRAAAGDHDRARPLAATVAERAARLRQVPLEWAAWGLVADLATRVGDRGAADRATTCALHLARRLAAQQPRFGVSAS